MSQRRDLKAPSRANLLSFLPTAMLLVLPLALGGCGGADDEAAATPLPPIEAPASVVANAIVLPARRAELSFPTGGTIRRVGVEVGESVNTGDLLVRLDGAAQAAAVLQAEADLAAAEARVVELVAGATTEQRRAAAAQVEAARGGLVTARGLVNAADAQREQLEAGATERELRIAERQVASLRNLLWGAQARRDAICGRVEKKLADQADCDGAEAEIGRLYEQVRIAELERQALAEGARPEERRAAAAQVAQAAGQRDAALARLHETEARQRQVQDGATAAELATAKATVDRARAALEAARVAMHQRVLRAPFAGRVASVEVREGEFIAPGAVAVRVADPERWIVETDDLTELGIVDVDVGDQAEIRVDALEDTVLQGRVVEISDFGQSRVGDVVYRVRIEPRASDPRLRWNMSASVTIGDGGTTE